jgi:nucleotide-binding universal stress UspA family protein
MSIEGNLVEERKIHMPEVRTLMVAVDFSKYTLPTARCARKLSQTLKTRLLFVNVINQRDIDYLQRVIITGPTFDLNRFIQERVQARQADLSKLIGECGADPAVTRQMVRIGVPYQQLLAVIEEEKPDLLIMATKGRSDLADVVMGSCARSMYRRSPIPVLSLRGPRLSDQ